MIVVEAVDDNDVVDKGLRVSGKMTRLAKMVLFLHLYQRRHGFDLLRSESYDRWSCCRTRS